VLIGSTTVNMPSNEEQVEALQAPLTAKELLSNKESSPLKRIGMTLLALIIDTVIPIGFYFILRIFLDPLLAMFLSGLPALAVFFVRIIWKREVSSTALMIFFAFVVSAALSFATDDARILLIEKSLIMGIVGTIHLLSLIPFRLYSIQTKNRYTRCTITKGGHVKPLLYYNLDQLMPLGDMHPMYTDGEKVNKYTWMWKNIPHFRMHLYVLTGFSGMGLLAEFLVKMALILSSLSVDKVVLYSTGVFFGALSGLMSINVIYLFVVKRSFYRHVDECLANLYVALPQQIQHEPSAATYLLK